MKSIVLIQELIQSNLVGNKYPPTLYDLSYEDYSLKSRNFILIRTIMLEVCNVCDKEFSGMPRLRTKKSLCLVFLHPTALRSELWGLFIKIKKFHPDKNNNAGGLQCLWQRIFGHAPIKKQKKWCYGHVLETRWHVRLYSLVGGSNPRPPETAAQQHAAMPLRTSSRKGRAGWPLYRCLTFKKNSLVWFVSLMCEHHGNPYRCKHIKRCHVWRQWKTSKLNKL